MIDHSGLHNRYRRPMAGPRRMTFSRGLIAAPVILVVVGCSAVQAVGDFPNPKDTVTVYTTPPPPATGVVATVP